ncbi:hypothetical protein RY27_17470 [Litorilinea aerophila]|nr:hypothetical protein RY27_17470 [Litorilinea aerophila]
MTERYTQVSASVQMRQGNQLSPYMEQIGWKSTKVRFLSTNVWHRFPELISSMQQNTFRMMPKQCVGC